MAHCHAKFFLGADYTKEARMFDRVGLPLINKDRTLVQNYLDSRKLDVVVRSTYGRRRNKRKG
jgi:hypothetical protein